MKFIAVCCYFGRTVSLLLLLGVASGGNAQSVRIKLMNGKDGRPMANTCVNVWVGTERKQAMALPTEKEGVARLRLTDKDAEINTQSQWKNCGAFGVLNPHGCTLSRSPYLLKYLHIANWPDFGEEKAQTCDMAWYQQLTDAPTRMVRENGYECREMATQHVHCLLSQALATAQDLALPSSSE
jgi:hypothetical protein